MLETSAKAMKVMRGIGARPGAQTLHFLLPGGVKLEKEGSFGASKHECTRTVKGRTAVFVIRNAVKNWFHASYNLLDIMLAMLAAGVYRPGAPPVDIILLPPDKAHAGNLGNQIDILRAFADGGNVSLASDYKDEVVCYESAVFALTSNSALFRRDTALNKFGTVGNKACPEAFQTHAPYVQQHTATPPLESLPRLPGAGFGKVPAAGNGVRQVPAGESTAPSRTPLKPVAGYDVLAAIIRRHLGILTMKDDSSETLRVVLLVREKQQSGYQKQVRRQFYNKNEIADKLKRLPRVDLKVVDLQQYTFKQQITMLSSTALLIGMHGAGLTNAMFMLPGSAVLEVLPGSFSEAMMTQTLFKDISADAGLQYSSMKTAPDSCDASDSCTIPVEDMAAKVAAILQNVLKRRRMATSGGQKKMKNVAKGGPAVCKDPLRPCGGAVPLSLQHDASKLTKLCPALLQKVINPGAIDLPSRPGEPVRFHFPTGRVEGDGNTNTKGNFVLPWMFAFAVSRWFGVGFVTNAANGKGTWLEHLATEIPPPQRRASDDAIAQLCSRCTSAATCTQPYYSGEAMAAIGDVVQTALRKALIGVDLNLLEGDVVVHDRCQGEDSILLHSIYGPLPLSFYQAAPLDTKRFLIVGPPQRHKSTICQMVTQVLRSGLAAAAPGAEIVELPGSQVVDFARMVFAPRLMVGFSTYSLAAALASSGRVWTPLQWPPGLRGIESNPPGIAEKRLTTDVWQIQTGFLPVGRWKIVNATHLPGKRAARAELDIICAPPLTPVGKACRDADAKHKAYVWLKDH